MRKLIVGIDPGTTTAVALLDIDSSFADVASRRDFSFSAVCEYIVGRGNPVIIATDKKIVPENVRKLASTFGARVFKLESNLGVEEKENLTAKYSLANDHEQDALAAAVHARKRFSAFFEKVDRSLERKGFAGLKGDVKELLLKGEASNIEQALRLLAPVQKGESRIVSRLVDSKSVLELRKRLESYQKENAALRSRLAELEQRTKRLQEKLTEEQLRKAIVPAKRRTEGVAEKAAKLEKDYYIVVEYEPGRDVKDKVVIAERKADIAAISKKSPRAIIAGQQTYIKREDVDVPVLTKDSVAIKSIDGFLVAEKAAIDEQIKKSFISWLRDYKTRHEK